MTVTVIGILLCCLNLSKGQIFQGQPIESIQILRQYFTKQASSLNSLEQQANNKSVATCRALSGVIIYGYSSLNFKK